MGSTCCVISVVGRPDLVRGVTEIAVLSPQFVPRHTSTRATMSTPCRGWSASSAS